MINGWGIRFANYGNEKKLESMGVATNTRRGGLTDDWVTLAY